MGMTEIHVNSACGEPQAELPWQLATGLILGNGADFHKRPQSIRIGSKAMPPAGVRSGSRAVPGLSLTVAVDGTHVLRGFRLRRTSKSACRCATQIPHWHISKPLTADGLDATGGGGEARSRCAGAKFMCPSFSGTRDIDPTASSHNTWRHPAYTRTMRWFQYPEQLAPRPGWGEDHSRTIQLFFAAGNEI